MGLLESLGNYMYSQGFGQNLPAPTGDQQNPINILSRALGGTYKDLMSSPFAAGRAVEEYGLKPMMRNVVAPMIGMPMSPSASPTPQMTSFVPPQVSPYYTGDIEKDIAFSPPVSSPQVPTEIPGQQAQGGGGIPDWIKSLAPLLPSLIATGVGLASPRMLPGAAGFNEGMSEQTNKNRQFKLEEDKLVYDKEKESAKIDRDAWDAAEKAATELLKNSGLPADAKTLAALTQEIYNARVKGNPKNAPKIEEKMVTIKFSDGVTTDMTEAEAKLKGYIK